MTNLSSQQQTISVKKLVPDAKLPERANPTDSGADVFSVEDLVIEPKSREIIGTGIAISIPSGYDVIVKDKSGRALQEGLTVLGGVIDQGYSGQVKVILFNTSDEKVEIRAGQKIAQLVCRPVVYPVFNDVLDNPLVQNNSSRGTGGFGSTGL